MKACDPNVTPWHLDEADFPRRGDSTERLTHLLRYAVLAPSSHNTQPWRFSVSDDKISVYADTSRWLRVADADRRELYVSVGCALENLLVAAEHFGYAHRTTYLAASEDETPAARVEFVTDGQPSMCRPAELFDAIPQRRTNHNPFDGRPIAPEDMERLEAVCVEDGARLHLTDDVQIKRQVDRMMVEADAVQFADPAWREELGYWLGQGAFGTPWLMSKISQLAVTYLNLGKGTGKKDSELLMSAPVLGVISTVEDSHASEIKAGQVFERVALTATALGVRVHPMSQILEIEPLKADVKSLIPAPDVVPQHTFRLGYAEPEKDHTPRRPLAEVLV